MGRISSFKRIIVVFILGLICSSFFVFSAYAEVTSSDVIARRAELERELAALEIEIKQHAKLLIGKRQERVSIERDVDILNAEIKKAQLSIRARELEIEKLNTQIGTKEEKIDSLNVKLYREKESLAQLLRKTNQVDDYSLVEVVLSNQALSGFFEDVDTFTVIKTELKDSFVEIDATKNDTEIEKSSLENKKAAEVELRNIQRLEKQKIEVAEAEKKRILNVTKGQEATYQSILAAKEKTAAEIRTELFALRGSASIPFEEALRYANEASTVTGVRPALILGVIAQESNLGENVGQCLLTNVPNKGDGKGVNTGRYFSGVMKPDRDVDLFLTITEELGINFSSQVVSCPPSYGYGGAMGPAQFIPSTWNLYKERIATASQQNPPNPWNPRTAFIASALLMMDNGADRGTRASERLAALRYFAGWGNAEKPAYAFYGDGVLELADKYQRQIDILAAS